MIDPPRPDAGDGAPVGLVLEPRAHGGGRLVPLHLVEDLHQVPRRIRELIGRPVASVSVDPPASASAPLERPNAPIQRLGTGRPPGHVPQPRLGGVGDLQGMVIEIAPGPQVHGRAVAVALPEAKDGGEEGERFGQPRGPQFDVRQVRNVLDGFRGGAAHGPGSPLRCFHIIRVRSASSIRILSRARPP